MLPCPIVLPRDHVPVCVVIEVRRRPTGAWTGLSWPDLSPWADEGPAWLDAGLTAVVAIDISALFLEELGRERSR